MIGDYISFVIVGKSPEQKAWYWNAWAEIAALLNPIVAATTERTGVRSVQSLKQTHKEIRFGRLNWDEVSHQKWTHKSELTKSESDNWKFFETEVWSPRWSVCHRERRTPAFFMKIENPFAMLEHKEGQFNQFLQLSFAFNLFNGFRENVEDVLEQIDVLLDGVLKAVRIAPWNYRGDSIQNALNNHLHYIGMYDDLVPNLSKTKGGWSQWQRGSFSFPRNVR